MKHARDESILFTCYGSLLCVRHFEDIQFLLNPIVLSYINKLFTTTPYPVEQSSALAIITQCFSSIISQHHDTVPETNKP